MEILEFKSTITKEKFTVRAQQQIMRWQKDQQT